MSRWTLPWALAAGILAVDWAPAQDEAAKPAGENTAPASEFSKLHKTWEDLQARAKKLTDEARTADATRKKAIAKEFREVFAEHGQVQSQLQAAALAEYQADSKKNIAAGKFLSDMGADLAERNQFEEALALLKPLADQPGDLSDVYATAGVAAFSLDDFAAAGKYFATAKEKSALSGPAAQFAEEVENEKTKWEREQKLRAEEAKADDLPRVRLTTTKGDIVVELYENEAPNTVANFISLVEKKFYDGLAFHRVLPGFMAQGGDPSGDGTGGPEYNIECECDQPNARMHFRGTLSMAHSGKDTGGSQFFLTFRPTVHLDEKHTVFGRVIEGLDVLARLKRRDPAAYGRLPTPDKIVKAEVIRKRDHEYAPKTLPAKP